MAGRSLSRAATTLPESEKITLNLGFVDLGQVDLLIRDGFYSNRSDFIRTAIRQQLLQHGDALKHGSARRSLHLGIHHFTRAELEAVREAGERLELRVLGLASFASDVTPQLACDTIDSLLVLGALNAPAEVKAALADRMR